MGICIKGAALGYLLREKINHTFGVGADIPGF